jgi:hypothetical protein
MIYKRGYRKICEDCVVYLSKSIKKKDGSYKYSLFAFPLFWPEIGVFKGALCGRAGYFPALPG